MPSAIKPTTAQFAVTDTVAVNMGTVNAFRKSIDIQNVGTDDLYVHVGDADATTTNSHILIAGQTFSRPNGIITGCRVSAICAAGESTTAAVTQYGQ